MNQPGNDGSHATPQDPRPPYDWGLGEPPPNPNWIDTTLAESSPAESSPAESSPAESSPAESSPVAPEPTVAPTAPQPPTNPPGPDPSAPAAASEVDPWASAAPLFADEVAPVFPPTPLAASPSTPPPVDGPPTGPTLTAGAAPQPFEPAPQQPFEHQPFEGGPGAPVNDDYVIEHAPGPVFADAPDPFGAPSAPTAAPAEEKKGKKGILVAIAAIVALALAAGAYFLFFNKGNSTDNEANSSTSASASADASASGSAAPSSGADPSSGGGSGAASPALSGTFSVNGTVESYSGPQQGQLGNSAKGAGDPVFAQPQTWTFAEGCASGESCSMTIAPTNAEVTLSFANGVWSGQSEASMQCGAAGPVVQGTEKYEIAQDGTTATRTVNAPCSTPIVEVDKLTLTKQ